MGRGVVLCLRERPVVVHLALVHQIGKLRVGLAQDQRPVVRNMHLPQRFNHQRVALAAACCTAVQRFRFRAAHELGLPRLGPPDHRHSCFLCNAHGSSSTVGRSTTPHSGPSACVPLIVQGLGHTGQILEHRRGLLEVFHGACCPAAPVFFAAFCRAFSSRTCCASRVLRVSVARLRLASPLACFVCPMVLGISSFPPWCAGLWQKDTPGAAFRQGALFRAIQYILNSKIRSV